MSQHRKRIAEWREERYLTLAALAGKIGVQPQTVWRWEQREAKPTRTNILRMAEALGIQPSQIIVEDPLPEAELKRIRAERAAQRAAKKDERPAA